MQLYPRLPLTVARTIAKELLSQPIESLFTLSSTNHAAMTYAPTGGNRVSETDLRNISHSIRDNARSFGYPNSTDDLKMHDFDVNTGRILYETMEITPSEASNLGIWAFTTCVLWPDIVRWRFPGNTDGTSKERFMGGRRNTFSRLWWRAYLLKELNSDRPYELLNALNEDELVQITERPSIAGSPILVKEVCRTFLKITNESANMPRSRLILRDAMKRLRRLVPIISFDAIDEQALRYVVNEVFEASIQFLMDE